MKYRPACQVALLTTVFVFPFVLSVTPVNGNENSSDKSLVKKNIDLSKTSTINYQVVDSPVHISEAPPPGAPVPGGYIQKEKRPGSSSQITDTVQPNGKLPNNSPAGNEIKPVEAKLVVSNTKPKQGDVVKVSVIGLSRTDEEESYITFVKNKVKLFSEAQSNRMSCLLGIPVTISPGKHAITYGGKSIFITVVNAKYPVRNLRLPKKKNNFKASPGEKETIKKAKMALSDRKLWTGKFQRPVKKSRISSVFGIRRRVNGKLLKDYFHSGTDFAASRGTPIYSCAKGKVIVAKTGWRLHGNTVCIDHGQGVISIYIHMNSLSVKQGQIVKAGQKIGAIGSTGRASGPHLHFGIYVNNTATNPMNWFSKAF